jgi:Tfp pilus assembly protein PilN
MRLFNKQGSGAGGQAMQPWHPNFRNTAELPDIKTVRTKFFINAAAVVLAVGALMYWLYIEYNFRGLNQQVAGVEQEISRNSKPSREAIANYKKFKDEQGKITELNAFADTQKIVFSDFVIELGKTIPEHVTVSTVQLRASDISVKGLVKSSAETASTIASQYEKTLREDADLSKRFASISLASLSRDTSGNLSFEMVFKFKS